MNSSSQDTDIDQSVISILDEEDNEVEIVQDFLPQKRAASSQSDAKDKKYRKPKDKDSFSSKTLFGILPWTLQESSDSEDDLIFPLPSEQACIIDEFVQDDGILDHETGLGLDNKEKSKELTHGIKDHLKSGAPTATEDDQIMKYIHKKFRKSPSERSKYLDESRNIKKITIPNIYQKFNKEKTDMTANLRSIR